MTFVLALISVTLVPIDAIGYGNCGVNCANNIANGIGTSGLFCGEVWLSPENPSWPMNIDDRSGTMSSWTSCNWIVHAAPGHEVSMYLADNSSSQYIFVNRFKEGNSSTTKTCEGSDLEPCKQATGQSLSVRLHNPPLFRFSLRLDFAMLKAVTKMDEEKSQPTNCDCGDFERRITLENTEITMTAPGSNGSAATQCDCFWRIFAPIDGENCAVHVKPVSYSLHRQHYYAVVYQGMQPLNGTRQYSQVSWYSGVSNNYNTEPFKIVSQEGVLGLGFISDKTADTSESHFSIKFSLSEACQSSCYVDSCLNGGGCNAGECKCMQGFQGDWCQLSTAEVREVSRNRALATIGALAFAGALVLAALFGWLWWRKRRTKIVPEPLYCNVYDVVGPASDRLSEPYASIGSADVCENETRLWLRIPKPPSFKPPPIPVSAFSGYSDCLRFRLNLEEALLTDRRRPQVTFRPPVSNDDTSRADESFYKLTSESSNDDCDRSSIASSLLY